jgi:hypothetical protein
MLHAKRFSNSTLFIALIVSAILITERSAKANLVNSNSIVEDDIEYYMQTDKDVYDLGENIEILYRVTNLRGEDVTFGFNYGPIDDRCDYIVEKEGERIWDNIGRKVTTVLTSFNLSPFESYEYTHTWDMTDFNGIPIDSGYYDITAALGYPSSHDRYVPVSVSIDVIPEPATIALLGTGIALLTRNKKMAGM